VGEGNAIVVPGVVVVGVPVPPGARVVVVTPGIGIVGVPPRVVVVVPPGVLVVVTPQLPAAQASQQLVAPPHAAPPFVAVHFASLGFSEHLVAPFGVVRQHATEPVEPHVDFFAHRRTSARHVFGRLPLFTAAFATPATQCTYAAWATAVAQGHWSSAAARADAIAVGSHAARAVPIQSSSEAAESTTRDIGGPPYELRGGARRIRVREAGSERYMHVPWTQVETGTPRSSGRRVVSALAATSTRDDRPRDEGRRPATDQPRASSP
jgi:hypothetical protein